MDYLLIKLWPWMLAALGTGFLTGWLSCSPGDDDNY
jgi:hypothetical protein